MYDMYMYILYIWDDSSCNQAIIHGISPITWVDLFASVCETLKLIDSLGWVIPTFTDGQS